jgi:hypothetical protein
MALFDFLSGKDPNKELRAEDKKRRKAAKTAARADFSYNKAVFEAEKANYYAQREYAFDTAMRQYNYNVEIQDYQYAQALASYERDDAIYNQQTNFNEIARDLAISDEKAGLQDLALQQAFTRESIFADLDNTLINQTFDTLQQKANLFGIKSNERIQTESIQTEINRISKSNSFEKEAQFVKGLEKGGEASLGQAGKSRGKGVQSSQAESFRALTQLDSSLRGSRRNAGVQLLNLQVDSSVRETGVGLNINKIEQAIEYAKEEAYFNNRVLAANMTSAIGQAERNVQQINLQKYQADLNAQARKSLFPEPLPSLPEPELPPERNFVKPILQEVYVPKGPRVDTGFSAVAGDVLSVVPVIGSTVNSLQNLSFRPPSSP